MSIFDTFIAANTTIDPDLMRQETEATGISTGHTESKAETIGSANRLTSKQLRQFYEQSSAIRPAVDGIVRELAYMKWTVKTEKDDIEITPDEQARIDEVTGLFKHYNDNNKPLSFLLTQVINDALILDRMAIEIVKGQGQGEDKVIEIWERDAATITPIIERSGIWKGYIQKTKVHLTSSESKNIFFPPDRMIFASLFPRPDKPFGTPIIETIINEVISLIFSIQHIGVQFTADEIPPGVLWLGEDMARDIWNRVQSSLRQGRRKKFDDLKLRIYSGGSVAPKWIKMSRENRDVQMRELRKDIEDIVWVNFGVSPVKMGRTEGVNRSNVQEISRWQDSGLTGPLIKMLSSAVTTGVIHEGFGYDDLIWTLVPDREENNKENADIAEQLTSNGIFTVNGVRRKIYNEDPFEAPAADKPFIVTTQGIQFLEDLDSTGDEDIEEDPEDVDLTLSMENIDLLCRSHSDLAWERTRGWGDLSIIKAHNQSRASGVPLSQFDLTAVDPTAAAYETLLHSIWNEAQRQIISSIKGSTISVKSERIENPEKMKEEIAIVLAGMLTLFNDAAGKAFSIGADIGVDQSQLFDADAELSDVRIAELVKEHQNKNLLFLQGALLRDVVNKLRKATTERFESLTALIDSANNAFDSNVFRLHRYANAVIPIGAEVFSLALDALKVYNYNWLIVGDDQECDACLDAFAGSPYPSRRMFPFLPGNSTQCNGNCRCTVEAFRVEPKRI